MSNLGIHIIFTKNLVYEKIDRTMTNWITRYLVTYDLSKYFLWIVFSLYECDVIMFEEIGGP